MAAGWRGAPWPDGTTFSETAFGRWLLVYGTTPSELLSSGPGLPRFPMMEWTVTHGATGRAFKVARTGCAGESVWMLLSFPRPRVLRNALAVKPGLSFFTRV